MRYTFLMSDAFGDDYELTVEADTEEKARTIANRIDDDAVVAKLLSKVEHNG